MKKHRTQQGRRFLGDMDIAYLEDGKTKDKERNRFNKKHLQAYLKGKRSFYFGRDLTNKLKGQCNKKVLSL